MLKIYGSEMCSDCVECKKNFDIYNIEYEFLDINKSLRNVNYPRLKHLGFLFHSLILSIDSRTIFTRGCKLHKTIRSTFHRDVL